MQTLEVLFLLPDNFDRDVFFDEINNYVMEWWGGVESEVRPNLTDGENRTTLPVRD